MISMVLLTGVNNVFLNKMLNFNNPISIAWKSAWSSFSALSSPPAFICLVVDESARVGGGLGKWCVGGGDVLGSYQQGKTYLIGF